MKNYKATLVAALALFAASAFIFAGAKTTDAEKKTVSKDLNFSLKTHEGKTFTLDKAKGKNGVVLVFFATWCPPCMAEVPHLREFAEKSAENGVLLYGVNYQESKKTVKKFAESRKINYPLLLDEKGKIAEKFNVTSIPYFVGIDKTGKVTYRGNALPKDENAFLKLLNAPGLQQPTEFKKDESGVRFITKETLHEWMNDGESLLIVDVLSADRYNQNHVKGAINAPLANLDRYAEKLNPNDRIVLYCGSFQCRASTKGVKLLMDKGFRNVFDYEGGIKDWKDAGLPVEKGA